MNLKKINKICCSIKWVIMSTYITVTSFVQLGCDSQNWINMKKERKPPTWNKEIKKFSECAEIENYLLQTRSEPIPENEPVNTVGDAQHYQNQVQDVIEGDILQSTEDYFYFSRKNWIEVISKKTRTLVHSIESTDDFYTKNSLITYNGLLINLKDDSNSTTISVFNENKHWGLLLNRHLNSRLTDYRVFKNRLYLLTQGYFKNPYQLENISCNQIFRPHYEDGSNNLTLVYSFDLNNLNTEPQTLGILGSTNQLYMTKENIFLFSGYEYYYNHDDAHPHFRVINYSEDTLELVQLVEFEGNLKDRYSIYSSKNDKVLYLSLTNLRDFNLPKTNSILAFEKIGSSNSKDNKQFSLVGKSVEFASNEDIRAVSYIEVNEKTYAYVVTFEKTDPLFVIDITDPEHIEILSELKVPGFSTNLIKLSTTLLAGFGYDAYSENWGFSLFQGLKFSLFNMIDQSNPTELDHTIWGDRGSFSEATSNPKAFYLTNDNKTVILPAVIYKKIPEEEKNNASWDLSSHLDFAGAILLNLDGNKIKELGRISHTEWRNESCGNNSSAGRFYWWDTLNVSKDVQRVLEFQGNWVSFSPFGVKYQNKEDLNLVHQIKFSKDSNNSQCITEGYPSGI